MEKRITEKCPTQNTEYTIFVEYHSLNDPNSINKYVKGLANCDYRKMGLCNIDRCPVYASAPEYLR